MLLSWQLLADFLFPGDVGHPGTSSFAGLVQLTCLPSGSRGHEQLQRIFWLRADSHLELYRTETDPQHPFQSICSPAGFMVVAFWELFLLGFHSIAPLHVLPTAELAAASCSFSSHVNSYWDKKSWFSPGSTEISCVGDPAGPGVMWGRAEPPAISSNKIS